MGVLDEFPDDLAPFVALQVNRNASLVAIGADIQRAFAPDPDVSRRPRALKTALGRFNHDHVRSLVRQELSGERPQQEMIEADDLDAFEHAHGLSCFGNIVFLFTLEVRLAFFDESLHPLFLVRRRKEMPQGEALGRQARLKG